MINSLEVFFFAVSTYMKPLPFLPQLQRSTNCKVWRNKHTAELPYCVLNKAKSKTISPFINFCCEYTAELLAELLWNLLDMVLTNTYVKVKMDLSLSRQKSCHRATDCQ